MEGVVEDALTRVLRETSRKDVDLRRACEEALGALNVQ